MVVALNPDQVPALDVRFAIEIKDRRLTMSKALDELDAAMKNREALAGLIVFSNGNLAPTAEPFQPVGLDRAVVVLDKDCPDDKALRLAYMWARWVCLSKVASEKNEIGIDVDLIATLIDEARKALERASTIRRAHTGAANKIDEAATHLDALVDQVNQKLEAALQSMSG